VRLRRPESEKARDSILFRFEFFSKETSHNCRQNWKLRELIDSIPRQITIFLRQDDSNPPEGSKCLSTVSESCYNNRRYWFLLPSITSDESEGRNASIPDNENARSLIVTSSMSRSIRIENNEEQDWKQQTPISEKRDGISIQSNPDLWKVAGPRT
jgi:hypothetical protein